jgi:two-component system NtrC family sensor kinase
MWYNSFDLCHISPADQRRWRGNEKTLGATAQLAVAAYPHHQLCPDDSHYYRPWLSDDLQRHQQLSEDNKLNDISATARRLASSHVVSYNIISASQTDETAIQALRAQVDNEISNLPPGTERFVVITDREGKGITGCVSSKGLTESITCQTDWASLPIVNSILAQGEHQAATEVIPHNILTWVGLEEQARITLIDTPKAAKEPFNPREGTAGLVLVSGAPVYSKDRENIGSVLVGHLFNNDFTLVDRIKEVAGVDTVTIFFGDLRVSTNVEDEFGNRAIGTRVSQEVFDQVLLEGKEFTGPAYVVNQWYITRYQPLYNHQDEIVGMLYVGAKQAAFQRPLETLRGQVFLITGATLLLAILIAIPLSLSISRPFTDLTTATRKVAQGDWSVRVPLDGFQEMHTQAESFNTMVETLQVTQEQLIQQEKLASVGQLAAGVAHEINNPLGSVLLYADILYKETPKEDEQQREDLQMIIREATRCKTIVNDLLNFSRQNEILAQDTDLNAMLLELAEAQSKQGIYENVRIVTDLAPDLGAIQADPLQLHQVFINLMNNAAEAMPDGGELILRTRKGPAPGFVMIEIQDTGVGISEENMKKIFTPFFTTKPIGKGTGLGLAIIYGIVKMHRGQIKVQSAVGQGTTFTITLREQLPLQNELPESGFVLQ